MLTLAGKLVEHRNFDSNSRIVIRVADKKDRIAGLRGAEAFLARGNNLPEGFGAYIALAKDAAVLDELPTDVRRFVLPNDFSYLSTAMCCGFGRPKTQYVHFIDVVQITTAFLLRSVAIITA
jgi:hypothetical protein